jgi:YbgC/YbaW family acyl-CoA thioester hydrolase
VGHSITIRRRVQWMDTDAAGVWHHSTAVRWMEEVEAELHRELGIIDETFGRTPRVHVEFDFGAPVRFDDEVDITLEVADIGSTSATYDFTVERAGERVVTGKVVIVLIDDVAGRARPWPDHLRSSLSG